ncbi:MAG: hypothetical protein E6K19_07025 [Methanobacteriota archaeon]|nr:MAG: hypothetical protein E6K19_07025 [Euryarchaeota archaeon]
MGGTVEAKKWLREAAKYLLHGTLFAIVTDVFAIFWAFIFLFLAIIGSLLGIILGFVLLFVFMGFANSIVTGLLWFPVRKGFWIYLAQGFLLGIAIVVIELLPLLLFVSELTALDLTGRILLQIVLFILYAFIDGYLGKAIGGIWKEARVRAALGVSRLRPVPEFVPETKNPDGLRCPRCNGVRLVVETDRSAYCIDCRRGIHPSTWRATTS